MLIGRYSWLNAQETRQRRIDEAAAALYRKNHPEDLIDDNHPQADTLARREMILGHPPLSARTLTTQVSSVRDEPTPTTPTSRAQSPIPQSTSKEGTPNPSTTEKTSAEDPTAVKQKVREQDSKTLSDELFRTMLTKIDTQPSSTPSVLPEQEQARETKVTTKREEKEINYKTSDFVKQGLIPMSLAWRAFEQGSKNERSGEMGTDGDLPGVEFSLENL